MPQDLLRALSQLPCYVTLLDRRGRIRWLNQSGHGHDLDDVIGEHACELVHPDEKEAWKALFYRAWVNRELVRYTVRVIAPPDGHSRIRGRMCPVILGGEVRYVACMTYDCTFDPEEQPVAAPPPRQAGGRWLSGTEERIVKALEGGGWMSSAQIAGVLGFTDAERLKALLTNLADRDILDSAPGRGYRRRDIAEANG